MQTEAVLYSTASSHRRRISSHVAVDFKAVWSTRANISVFSIKKPHFRKCFVSLPQLYALFFSLASACDNFLTF